MLKYPYDEAELRCHVPFYPHATAAFKSRLSLVKMKVRNRHDSTSSNLCNSRNVGIFV